MLLQFMNEAISKAAVAAPLPAPTVASVSPNAGDIDGGALTNVVITGTHFVNGATVTIGGVSCPVVTFGSATSLTVKHPTGTVGAKDIVVTNPDAQTSTGGTGLFTFTSLTTLSLSGLWIGDDYNGTDTWTSRASAGTSGNSAQRNFTNTGGLTAPAAGVALGGRGTVRWTRTNSERLETTKLTSDFVTDGHNFGIGILLNVIDVVTDNGGGGGTYTNETYIGDTDGNWNVSAYATGPKFTAGTWPSSNDISFSTGAYVFLFVRGHAGGNVQCSLNGGAFNTDVSGSGIGALNAKLSAGRGNTAAYVNATVACMFMMDGVPSDADRDTAWAALKARYGVT